MPKTWLVRLWYVLIVKIQLLDYFNPPNTGLAISSIIKRRLVALLSRILGLSLNTDGPPGLFNQLH